MRKLTESMMRLGWTMSVFGMKQMSSGMTATGEEAAVADADAVNATARATLDNKMLQMVEAGDRFSETMANLMIPIEKAAGNAETQTHLPSSSFRQAVETGNMELLKSILAPDFQAYSPLSPVPITSKDAYAGFVGSLATHFANFRYTHEAVGPNSLALVLSATVKGLPGFPDDYPAQDIQTTDFLEFNELGQIQKVTSMSRPIQALDLFARRLKQVNVLPQCNFRRAIMTGDMDLMAKSLAADFEAYNPLQVTPTVANKKAFTDFLGQLTGYFTDFKYNHEVAGPNSMALVLSAMVKPIGSHTEPIKIETTDFLEFNAAGEIKKITSMSRPKDAVAQLAEHVAAAYAAAAAAG